MPSDSPAASARALKRRHDRLLPGTILSFTTIAHPPKGFPTSSRTIGLIELTNGKRVLAPLITSNPAPVIGEEVLPRLRLSRINEQGLRLYEVAYECTAKVVSQKKVTAFPGYILALAGPAGVGKKTVSTLLTRIMGDFTAKVPVVTSRALRENEGDDFVSVELCEFERLQRSGEIVAWTRIASGDRSHFYGYRKQDIAAIWKEGKIPVVVTEMRLLEGLACNFGRRSILSCGLLPPGQSKRTMLSHLLHRLRSRGHETEEQMQQRLENAEADITYLQQSHHLFDHILVNEDLDTVVQTIKGHVLALNEAVNE